MTQKITPQMARLNATCDSDEEFPDVETILHPSGRTVPQTPRKGLKSDHGVQASPGFLTSRRNAKEHGAQEKAGTRSKDVTNVSCSEKQSSRQWPLGSIKANSLLLPLAGGRLMKAGSTKEPTSINTFDGVRPLRSSPRKTAKHPMKFKVIIPESSSISGSEEEYHSDNLSGFIVDGSASDSGDALTRSAKATVQRVRKLSTPSSEKLHQLVIDESATSKENIPLQETNKYIMKSSRKFKSLADKPYLPAPGHISSGQAPRHEIIDLTSVAQTVPRIACNDSLPKSHYSPSKTEPSRDHARDPAPAVLQ